MERYIKEIEKTIMKNCETRKMNGVELENQLINISNDINDSEVILILTGFCVRKSMSGETDGPVGAVSLAKSLELLDKKVIIVTDKYSRKIIESCYSLLNIKAKLLVVPDNDSDKYCIQIIDKYRPNHVIAIERPGRAKNGKSHSMRGEDISDICPNTDNLITYAKKNNIKTSAIGDGGNEVGMGKISSYIAENVYKGKQICADVSADNLLVAGISNWGAYGITAILSIMNNRVLMNDENIERIVLKKMVEAGAVDGCTGNKTLSVDGLSMEENIEIFSYLKSIVHKAIERKKAV